MPWCKRCGNHFNKKECPAKKPRVCLECKKLSKEEWVSRMHLKYWDRKDPKIEELKKDERE